MAMNGSAAGSGPSDGARRIRAVRRDVWIASLVLGILALGIGAYLLSARRSEPPAPRPEISAAAWVGSGAPDGAAGAPAPAADAGEASPPAFRYAPTEEELKPVPPADAGSGAARSQPDSGEPEQVASGTVQKGVAVITSLTRLGLSVADAHALISALDGIFDFTTTRPGQMFELRYDTRTKKPIYFRFDASLTDVFEVVREGAHLKGSKKKIDTEKILRRYGGTISSSLYDALKDLGAHPSLSGNIVEVLQNQVDFYKAQRPGDSFRVLIEETALKGDFLGYGPVLALEYNGTKSGRKRFFRFQAGKDRATYYSEKGVSVPHSVISIPLHYTRLSSPFGRRYHPILRRMQMHSGVDFAASPGSPVWACKAGTVAIAERRGANGNLVIIDHGQGLQSYYAHLSRFARGIRAGAEVRERQVIGYVGSTGRSTGPHLHFGLKLIGRFIDPLKYKVRPGTPVAPKYRSKLMAEIADGSRALDNIPIRPPTGPMEEPSASEKEEVLGVEEL